MKTKALWALVALNVLLLAVLVSPYGRSNTATAQVGMRPSEYIMIPGDVIGGNSAVVYVIDTNNHQLTAMALDQRGTAVDSMPPIDLNRVFTGGVGAAGGGR